ncbi:hypothetical protein JHK87_044672 [Glycine soja]|nr:hypothetical protein JHK87_044672 [Glycine soja]
MDLTHWTHPNRDGRIHTPLGLSVIRDDKVYPNPMGSQCAYDVAPGGLLFASVYYLTRLEYGIDQPEEVCIKIFVARKNPRIPSIFWVWKSVDFQEKESYDVLGISYDNHSCQT